MSAIYRFCIQISQKIRPLLLKLLPIEFLRRIKARFISSSKDAIANFSGVAFFPAQWEKGINLIGYIRGEIGLGQSCRLVAASIDASGVDYTIYNYNQVSAMRSADHAWDDKITNTLPYGINIMHINPYELPLAYSMLTPSAWKTHYNIAFWLWELEEFPEDWCFAFPLFHEIWTPSEFVSNSIRKKTSLPVYTIPYPIEAPADQNFNRPYFKLPEDKFLFLTMYDSNSTMERKNPLGVLRAFKTAFSCNDERVGLVIKINNPQKQDLQAISKALAGYGNIYILSDILSKVQVNSLIQCTDVFVSLHRAEGFGLVLAEAMLLGTPAIATNWSSNTEFMDKNTACMVDYEFVTLTKDCGPYPKGARWAEPDEAQAATYMQRLCSDSEYYQSLQKAAQASITKLLSKENAANLINKRVEAIYAKYQ